MKKINNIASSVYSSTFKSGEYVFGEHKDKIVVNEVLHNINDLTIVNSPDYDQNNVNLGLFTRTFKSWAGDASWANKGLGNYAYDGKIGSLQTYYYRVFSDSEGWLVEGEFDRFRIDNENTVIFSPNPDSPYYKYFSPVYNNLLCSTTTSATSLSYRSITPIQSLQYKGMMYVFHSGYLRRYRFINYGFNYDGYQTLDSAAGQQGFNIIRNTDHEIIVQGFDSYNRSFVYKFSLIAGLQKYYYMNPTFINNTNGYLPIDSSDGAVGIHNMPTYYNYLAVTYISQMYKNENGIEEYYIHKGINIIDNNEAPYIETYIDSDGVEQEYDMTQYNDKTARYFNVFKIIINHNDRTYYHKKIDIDHSSYANWYADDRTSVTTVKKSYDVSSTMACENEMYGCKCKLFNIDGVEYLLTLSAVMNDAHNKYIACVFTITGDESIKLQGSPYIFHSYNDSASSGITLIDDHDFIIHKYSISTYDKMRISWDPENAWTTVMLNNYYTNTGMYIDKTERVWCVNLQNELHIGTKNDIVVEYLSDMHNTIELNGGVFEVEVKLNTLLGKLLRDIEIAVSLVGTNITFDDDSINKNIITDNKGIMSFNIKIPLDTKEDFSIEYRLIN